MTRLISTFVFSADREKVGNLPTDFATIACGITAWLNSQGGLLILDKTIDSNIDEGQELFSNSAVNEQSRGVASLVVVDADGNGTIDAADPVFTSPGVWRDKSSNGLFDSGEVSNLADLGITSLNYLAGAASSRYKKRSGLCPYLLSREAKTPLKRLQRSSKRATGGRRNPFETPKPLDLAMKSGRRPIITGITRYEMNSNISISGEYL